MIDFFDIKQNSAIKTRESGIELLRILSIFFVVVIHEIPTFLPYDNLFVLMGRIISWPAIFSFAFITGYFLILRNNGGNKVKRFLWLSLEIVIWRILIASIYLIVTSIVEGYTINQFFNNFFGEIILDLFSIRFWYFWGIIFIYLVFPFFASYLESNYETGKKLLKWILIFFFLITIMATIGSLLIKVLSYNFSLYDDEYTFGVVLFAAILGGYWHLIEKEKRLQYNWKTQLFALAGLIIVYLINFSFAWWLNDSDSALTYLNTLWYLAGGFYFLIFKGFKFHSNFINWWSGLSWWIYVLHNGTYLPRGWALAIMRTTSLDLYSCTILSILLCYFITLVLVLATQNFDRFVFKPYIWLSWKTFWVKIWKYNKSPNKIKK
ncbi:acyltransferase family protein [Spiroplasma platyhelix]|uniref:Acyltransferase n=1 Tax=Spiroplasma platyhelix PALS-1 TaxID=1276218 RepID=A0A846TWS2_9MOLU|nr:acyltransferase [Spiroplasma platyhelix]MBE4704121.1 hypothetical protein [Spiroplasma platyhelix PALS-1]NKE38491.1 acyltransferase [Spiroplasma platyhelix PALS-1]UJB29379.1 hypothetical protein SPLAT_v1c06150 [Spiroplasma platyhelix PALS-1]